jgi:oligopeptide transport system substrate-binding protein
MLRLAFLSLCSLLAFGCSRVEKKGPPPVRIALPADVTSCDPRKARSLATINIVRCLYEGLTCHDENQKPTLALAKKITISPDQKTYTITLKDATWSNGDSITAQDFEYSIKTALTPSFKAPNAYQLFVLKGAKQFFEGKGDGTIGVVALDDKTLQFTLEIPTPYFLELLSSDAFFPIPKKWLLAHPEKQELDLTCPISSGPYMVEEWKPNQEICLKKNPLYWNKERVTVERLSFVILEESVALSLFEKGELDWAGSPISTLPPDSIRTLKENHRLQATEAAGTALIRSRVSHPLLSSKKLRQALSYAIDREGITEHILQGGHVPTLRFLPPCVGGKNSEPIAYAANCTLAKKLLDEALSERNITIEKFPKLSLTFTSNERNLKIAQVIKQNYKEVLGIDLTLEPQEGKIYFERIAKKNYDLALGSWIGNFCDPIDFLSVFQNKDNGTNNTDWESSEFAQNIELSSGVNDIACRRIMLQTAEDILLADQPIFPIFHYTYNFLKSERLANARVSPFGIIDVNGPLVVAQRL